MKIAFYTDYPPFEEKGGAEIRIKRIAEKLVEREHEVSVFSGGKTRTERKLNGVKYHIYRNWWEGLPIGLRNLVYIIQTFWRFVFFGRKIEDFDLIDAYRPLKGCDVQSFAGSAITGFGESLILKKLILIFLIPIEFLSVKNVNCVIAVSEAVKRDIVEVYNVTGESIYVTYAGTDKEFLQAERNEKGSNVTISAVKGKEMMNRLSNLFPHLDFEFIEGVEHKEVLEKMRNTDVFIHHSRADGLSMAVREAMAVGLPVIATDVGGIPEIIDNGEDGFLVQVGDSAKVKALLTLLLENYDFSEEIGKRAKSKIRDRFTWKETVESTLEVYRGVRNIRGKI